MKNLFSFGLLLPLLLGTLAARAQVGIGTITPDPSAVLDVKSTTKGLLLPRLTAAQRTAIANPAEGLLVSQTNLVKGPYYFDGSTWTNLITGTYGSATDNAGSSSPLSGQTEAGSADGSAGVAAAFSNPTGVTLDGSGNLYVVDQYNNALRRVALAAGTVSTVAGGSYGTADGTGRAAQFRVPYAVALSGGFAYVNDGYLSNVRRVALATGVVTTLGFAAQDGGIVADGNGNLYVASTQNQVLKYVISTGAVSVVAGGTLSGYQDGTGTAARFSGISGLVLNASGTILYVAEQFNHRIRQVVLATGVVTTLAGNGTAALANGTGPANTSFNTPCGLALDGSGNLYVGDRGNNVVRKLVLATGTVSTLATGLNQPIGLAYESSSSSLYVADAGSNQIRRVVVATGQVSTVAGSPAGGSADGQSVTGRFNSPRGVVVSTAGVAYVADAGNHAIRQVSAAGVVSTWAGTTGAAGTADGTGSAARFNTPSGLALDGSSGTVYVADAGNHTIRKITSDGVVSTLAGTGGSAGTADGTGPAARFNTPTGVALDAAGNVYVADQGNHIIRKITPAGVVTTLAGTAGTAGAANGSGPAASFSSPTGLVATAAGTLYVADAGNHLIRTITSAGVVSTLAGQAGVAGQANGGGSVATFNTPAGVALAPNGALCVADQNNHLIREVSTTTGATTTLAGSTAGYAEGSGTAARFSSPRGVTIAADGTVYVADTGNNRVRKLQ